jgi:hypothetical protein
MFHDLVICHLIREASCAGSKGLKEGTETLRRLDLEKEFVAKIT